MTTRGRGMCGTRHLVSWVGIGDVNGKERVGSGGGGGGDGVVAGNGCGLGAEGGELAGEAVDHCFLLFLTLQVKFRGGEGTRMAEGHICLIC